MQKCPLPCCLILCLSFFLLGDIPMKSASAEAPAWPNWMGPNRDGVSSEADWSTNWPDDGLPVRWTRKIGIGFSSISIADTTGGVESNLDSLQRLGVRLKAITLNDTAVVSDDTTATNGKIDLTAEQVKRDAIVIGKVISSYQLAVHGASLAQSLALSKNKKVVTIDITDRGANIVKSLTMHIEIACLCKALW